MGKFRFQHFGGSWQLPGLSLPIRGVSAIASIVLAVLFFGGIGHGFRHHEDAAIPSRQAAVTHVVLPPVLIIGSRQPQDTSQVRSVSQAASLEAVAPLANHGNILQ